MLVLLFHTRMFFHLFLMLCFSWSINIACFTSFYCLDLVPSFSNYQSTSMLWFHFYYFFHFFTATNALATSWVAFLKDRTFLFFLFFDLFSSGSLMEINSTLMYFRSRLMLCLDEEKQKYKNTFKDNCQSGHFIFQCYCLLLKLYTLFCF